jgi:acyl carrier protein phosphodiesterase
MNYLAHIFLSGTDEAVVIGNFIGDYVKGRDYLMYPPNIRKGLVLHRKIDWFTDTHKIVQQSKKYFAPRYHKWAGITIDIIYDHFLIKNWSKFCPVSLDEYKQDIFDVLQKYYPVLPERVKYFVSSFIQNDWIGTCSTQEGIINILYRMSLRTPLPDESAFAAEVLHKYYIQLDSEFMTYFPELIRFCVANFELHIPLVDSNMLNEKRMF